MNRGQAFRAAIAGYAMLVAGSVWLYGPYALIVGGLLIFLLLTFAVDTDDSEKR